jgi:hypothetical protein
MPEDAAPASDGTIISSLAGGATEEGEDTAEDEAGGEEGKEPHPLPQCSLLEADSKEEKTH